MDMLVVVVRLLLDGKSHENGKIFVNFLVLAKVRASRMHLCPLSLAVSRENEGGKGVKLKHCKLKIH